MVVNLTLIISANLLISVNKIINQFILFIEFYQKNFQSADFLDLYVDLVLPHVTLLQLSDELLELMDTVIEVLYSVRKFKYKQIINVFYVICIILINKGDSFCVERGLSEIFVHTVVKKKDFLFPMLIFYVVEIL